MKYTTLNEKLKRYRLQIKRFSMILLPGVFLCLSTASSSWAANDLVKRARECMDIMNHQSASHLLRQAIVKKPRREGVRVDLAYALYQLGERDEALDALEQELILFPGSFNALILEAYLCFREGDIEHAVDVCRDFESELYLSIRDKVRIAAGKGKTFPPPEFMEQKQFFKRYKSYLEKIQKTHPNLGLPIFILGNHEKIQGNLDKAKIEFQFALEMGYDPGACFAQLIDVELTKKDWIQALRRTDEAESILGSRAEFHFLKGYGKFKLGDTKEAILCFERALDCKPFFVEVMMNLAKIKIMEAEYNEAISCLVKILGFQPFDSEAIRLLDLANDSCPPQSEDESLELSKNFVDAVELKYIYIFEQKISYVLWQAKEYVMDLIRANKLAEAADWLSRFLEIFDMTPELNYNLAKIYEHRNNLSRALRYAWRAKELNDDYRDAHDLIGSIFFKMQDFDNSYMAYRKALDLNPSDAQACYNLGLVCFSMRDLEKAEAYWKQAIRFEQELTDGPSEQKPSKNELNVGLTIKVKPISFESHKNLSLLYRKQDRNGEALAELEKALELRPNDAELCFEIGRFYLELMDRDKAVLFFDKYLALGGEEAKVKKILQ